MGKRPQLTEKERQERLEALGDLLVKNADDDTIKLAIKKARSEWEQKHKIKDADVRQQSATTATSATLSFGSNSNSSSSNTRCSQTPLTAEQRKERLEVLADILVKSADDDTIKSAMIKARDDWEHNIPTAPKPKAEIPTAAPSPVQVAVQGAIQVPAVDHAPVLVPADPPAEDPLTDPPADPPTDPPTEAPTNVSTTGSAPQFRSRTTPPQEMFPPQQYIPDSAAMPQQQQKSAPKIGSKIANLMKHLNDPVVEKVKPNDDDEPQQVEQCGKCGGRCCCDETDKEEMSVL